jgi:hypothetical protein
MADLVWVQWYATILRKGAFAEAVAEVAPIALRYGATQYQVHVSNDDRYKITQMTWVPSHASWYSYWEGPEMVEFRARYSGKYQVPIVYVWADEIAAGSPLNGGNGAQPPTVEPASSPVSSSPAE